MHLDWSASQFLTKQFQIGAVGYVYKEIGCDSGSGDRVGCFQSQVVGVGPQLGFIFPVGDLQGYLRRLIARRDLTLMELRKELKAQEAAQANAIKSMKGELAKQKQLFERKIEELEKQHRKELKIVEARSQIELNELRKKMEQREMKREEAVDKQSDQQDQFAASCQTILHREQQPRPDMKRKHIGKRPPESDTGARKQYGNSALGKFRLFRASPNMDSYVTFGPRTSI
jgi:hypothetical protein